MTADRFCFDFSLLCLSRISCSGAKGHPESEDRVFSCKLVSDSSEGDGIRAALLSDAHLPAFCCSLLSLERKQKRWEGKESYPRGRECCCRLQFCCETNAQEDDNEDGGQQGPRILFPFFATFAFLPSCLKGNSSIVGCCLSSTSSAGDEGMSEWQPLVPPIFPCFMQRLLQMLSR